MPPRIWLSGDHAVRVGRWPVLAPYPVPRDSARSEFRAAAPPETKPSPIQEVQLSRLAALMVQKCGSHLCSDL